MREDRDYLAETQLVPSVPGAPPVMVIINTPRPIRWATLDAYAMRAGFEGESYAHFMQLVGALDQEFLKVRAEQRAGITASDGDEDEDG